MLPGWHVFFARLGTMLSGDRVSEFEPPWRQMQVVYVGHYRLEGHQTDP
jgi:hypothetical protein